MYNACETVFLIARVEPPGLINLFHFLKCSCLGAQRTPLLQRSKPDLIANSILRKTESQRRYLGHPLGVKPGDVFEGRGELEALGIHGRTLLGIDGHGSSPAFAICMSGGYVDDEDTGAEIWYTGMGGQKGKRQVDAQQLVRVCHLCSCDRSCVVVHQQGRDHGFCVHLCANSMVL